MKCRIVRANRRVHWLPSKTKVAFNPRGAICVFDNRETRSVLPISTSLIKDHKLDSTAWGPKSPVATPKRPVSTMDSPGEGGMNAMIASQSRPILQDMNSCRARSLSRQFTGNYYLCFTRNSPGPNGPGKLQFKGHCKHFNNQIWLPVSKRCHSYALEECSLLEISRNPTKYMNSKRLLQAWLCRNALTN
jgi:hypothetical protein